MSSKRRPLGLIGVLAPHNQILELTQHPTIESQLHSSTLCKLQRDTKCSGP